MSIPDTRLHIGDEVLADLFRRLEGARRPTAPVRPAWADGVDPALIDALAGRWRSGFDWRAREALLNRHRHTWVDIDGVRVHAMLSQPEESTERLPLLALHGWPSTFEQMTRLVGELSIAGRAMNVVAPSLPGFGFSSAPSEPGWDPARIADVMNTLMVEHLGHTRYVVRGTDYGLTIALHLGAVHAEHVAGVHIGGTHLAVADDTELTQDLTAEERGFVEASRRWYAREGGYVAVQSTKPETLAYALSDSPIGLLAWIVEKYRTWCARPDDLHDSFSPDDLLSTATIYWATNTIASSMRLYREELLGSPAPRSVAPVAVSQPALEEYSTPESWWRRLQPLTRYTVLPGAGHFPEWEAPRELAADIVEFSSGLP